MNDVQARIDKLLDSGFVTDLLGLRSDEGCIAGYATGFYLEEADLESLRPMLNPAHHHADVGQIGCYCAKPVCSKAKWKAHGQPFTEYQVWGADTDRLVLLLQKGAAEFGAADDGGGM